MKQPAAISSPLRHLGVALLLAALGAAGCSRGGGGRGDTDGGTVRAAPSVDELKTELEPVARMASEAILSGDEQAFVDAHVRAGDMSSDGEFRLVQGPGKNVPDAAWEAEIRATFRSARDQLAQAGVTPGALTFGRVVDLQPWFSDSPSASGIRVELDASGVAVPMTLSEFAMKAQRGWVLTGSPVVTIELPASLPAPSTATTGSSAGNPFRLLDFKTEAEVVAAVGEPAAKWRKPDRVIWLYADVVPDLSGIPSRPELQFIDGQVRAVVFQSESQMADRIATAALHDGWIPHEGSRPKTMTFDEVLQLAVGRTRGDVVAALGEPNEKVVMDGVEGWLYDDLVAEARGPRRIVLMFAGDTASGVQGA